jgi:hypothetical protein
VGFRAITGALNTIVTLLAGAAAVLSPPETVIREVVGMTSLRDRI